VSVVCARGAKVINIKTMLIVSSRTSEIIYIYILTRLRWEWNSSGLGVVVVLRQIQRCFISMRETVPAEFHSTVCFMFLVFYSLITGSGILMQLEFL
jgi:hypothetical protein